MPHVATRCVIDLSKRLFFKLYLLFFADHSQVIDNVFLWQTREPEDDTPALYRFYYLRQIVTDYYETCYLRAFLYHCPKSSLSFRSHLICFIQDNYLEQIVDLLFPCNASPFCKPLYSVPHHFDASFVRRIQFKYVIFPILSEKLHCDA